MQLARGSIGVCVLLEAEITLPGEDQRGPGAKPNLSELERHLEIAMQVDRTLELLDGGVAIALEQRRLAERVRQGGERVEMSRLRADASQRLDHGVRVRSLTGVGEQG